jgi:hypothetical protein
VGLAAAEARHFCAQYDLVVFPLQSAVWRLLGRKKAPKAPAEEILEQTPESGCNGAAGAVEQRKCLQGFQMR